MGPAEAWAATAEEEAGELGVVKGERLVIGQLEVTICQLFKILNKKSKFKNQKSKRWVIGQLIITICQLFKIENKKIK